MSINKLDIGPRLNKYQGRRIRNIEVVATLTFLMIFFGIPFLNGLYRIIYGYAQFGPVAAFSWGIPWLFFSSVCFLIISIYTIYRLNIARVSIFLHKHGIIIRRMLRKERIIRWEDISALYVTQHQSRSSRTLLSTTAVFSTNENIRFSLRDSRIENLTELLTQIKASVYIHLYPKIRDRFRAGELVSFDQIKVHNNYIKISRGGLKLKSYQIPFTDINRITVKSGKLLIKFNNNEEFQISTAKVPNIEILLDLISRKTNVKNI